MLLEFPLVKYNKIYRKKDNNMVQYKQELTEMQKQNLKQLKDYCLFDDDFMTVVF